MGVFMGVSYGGHSAGASIETPLNSIALSTTIIKLKRAHYHALFKKEFTNWAVGMFMLSA